LPVFSFDSVTLGSSKGSTPRVAAAAAVAISVAPAAAQSGVSASDIQRLQEALVALEGEHARLQSRDAAAARTYETELQEVREEVIYLRVKYRKGQLQDRSEYRDLRDRIDDLRSKVTATQDPPPTTTAPRPTAPRPTAPAATAPPPATTPAATGVIPVGQELDVRLQTTLSSETAQPEQRFEATTAVDLTQNGRVLVPAGSMVRGVVSDVKKAGRVDRSGSLTLSFDQIEVNGREIPIRGTATQVFESGGIREEAGTAGVGAGVGGIIGGVLGGVKGAILGAVIGAGGAIAATDGKDITLPPGAIVRVRLNSPVAVR
jgi:hypothetical protein